MPVQQVTSTAPANAWLMSTDPPDPANPGAPSVLDVWEMMQAVATAGYRSVLTVYQEMLHTEDGTSTGQVGFMLNLTKPDFPDQLAPPGSWVVFDGTYVTVTDTAQFEVKYTTAQPIDEAPGGPIPIEQRQKKP